MMLILVLIVLFVLCMKIKTDVMFNSSDRELYMVWHCMQVPMVEL